MRPSVAVIGSGVIGLTVAAEAAPQNHLGELVRGTVEETLNAMLDAEQTNSAALAVASAARLVRTPGPAATSGYCRPARAK